MDDTEVIGRGIRFMGLADAYSTQIREAILDYSKNRDSEEEWKKLVRTCKTALDNYERFVKKGE